MMGLYPDNWPKCPNCGAPALDGHITCGDARCDESGHRNSNMGERGPLASPVKSTLGTQQPTQAAPGEEMLSAGRDRGDGVLRTPAVAFEILFPQFEIVEAARPMSNGDWHVYLQIAGTTKKAAAIWGKQEHKMIYARLFATAPKLLKALEQTLQALNDATHGDEYSEHMHTIVQARAAICEATGVLPDQQRQKEAANV